MNISIKAVLQDARAMVARGWCQGGSRSGIGVEMRRCAHAAIADAAGARYDYDRFRRALQVFMGAIGNSRVAEWNDAPERTLVEVLDAFDRAIEATE